MDDFSFERLVIELTASRLRDGVGDLIEELDTLPARELVLDLQGVPDDLLLRAMVRYLGVKRRVRIAGARARQVRALTWLGIRPDDILIGSWPMPPAGAPPE